MRAPCPVQVARIIRVRNRPRTGCTGMSNHETHIRRLDVDDLWLHEWASEGIAALECYLAKHAAFAAYLRACSDLQSADGDRRPDA